MKNTDSDKPNWSIKKLTLTQLKLRHTSSYSEVESSFKQSTSTYMIVLNHSTWVNVLSSSPAPSSSSLQSTSAPAAAPSSLASCSSAILCVLVNCITTINPVVLAITGPRRRRRANKDTSEWIESWNNETLSDRVSLNHRENSTRYLWNECLLLPSSKNSARLLLLAACQHTRTHTHPHTPTCTLT